MDFDEIVAIGPRHSQLPNRYAYRAAAQKLLLRLISANDALWIQAADRFGSDCVGHPFAVDQRLSGDLSRYWTRHVTRASRPHTLTSERRSECPTSSPHAAGADTSVPGVRDRDAAGTN